MTIKVLHETVREWRQRGEVIAYVPTMGNLHAGHIKLVTEAKQAADKVIVSIFVNPMQFGEGEDLTSYPRTENQDALQLEVVATDLLFLPDNAEMYQANANTVVSVEGLSKNYCGASRPGHFEGVATVVAKLFNMVQPDMAFFGQKDFQQLAIIRKMVEDLNFPVEIKEVETIREQDGLAMSSRNNYLTEQQRLVAPELYRSLCQAREAVSKGNKTLREIESAQQNQLNSLGFTVDYFVICNRTNLVKAIETDKELVILVAAKLGKPRLIDNLTLSL